MLDKKERLLVESRDECRQWQQRVTTMEGRVAAPHGRTEWLVAQ